MGGTLLLIGVVMLVTPGPGLLVLGLGLGLLAAEFAWARHWLRVIRERVGNAARNARRFAYGDDEEERRSEVAEQEEPEQGPGR